MLKTLAIVFLVVGCGGGGDKCEKAFDKMAPLLKDMKHKDGPAGDDKAMRDKEVAKCTDELKEHPARGAMLDCIIGTSGDMTEDKMMDCVKSSGKAEKKKEGGGGGGDVGEAKDKMCACKDTACSTKVSDDMTKWAQEQAKDAKAPPKMSEDDTKKMTAIGEEMGKCMQKAMTPATP